MRISVLLIAVIGVLILSCVNNTGEATSATSDSTETDIYSTDPDVASEWIEYLESSDDGAWEDIEEHSLTYRYMGLFCDEEALELAVYRPFALCISADTIFVSDAGTQQIVALDLEGEVLWKAGGEGEGPGHFPSVTTLAVSGTYVAGLNYHLSRIEFFHRDGSFSHSMGFGGPQDIAAIDDTTFVVASWTEPGGDIHILNSEQGIVRSFGEVEMIHYGDIPRSDLMRICVGDNGRLALFNRYEGLLAIYDIDTEECIYRGSRTYPAKPAPPQTVVDSDGEEGLMFAPIGGNAFRGPDGMLNILIPNYMEDGSFISDPEYLDFAPVTAVDRYDWNGNYLDSYCLPDSCLNYAVGLPDGRVVARNFAEGVLCHMERM